jgi:hypothetical protein
MWGVANAGIMVVKNESNAKAFTLVEALLFIRLTIAMGM